MKTRVILADRDFSYLQPILMRLISEYFNEINMEVIDNSVYLNTLFKKPQKIDIYIGSQDMFPENIHLHEIKYLFMLTEDSTDAFRDQNSSRIHYIYKYSSVSEIVNEIIGVSISTFKKNDVAAPKEAQVILFTGATGGTGKTSMAMAVSRCLSQNHKRVLYVNTDSIHTFQYMLKNQAALNDQKLYQQMAAGKIQYHHFQPFLRNEVFHYFPPLKASLLSLGIQESVFESIISSALQSNDFDYIVVDSDSNFGNLKTSLIEKANRVLFILNQSRYCIKAMNTVAASINGIESDKYIFICNRFEKERENGMLSSEIKPKFSILEYVQAYKTTEEGLLNTLSWDKEVQKIAFSLM